MDIKELIEKNNLVLKSQDEIKLKWEDIKNEKNMFDFRPEVLIEYLPFDFVKPMLKDEYLLKIESGEESWVQITEIDICAKAFLDYMEFAWGKAEDERGISASRSINKLSMWLWLMSREDLSETIQQDHLYNPYGAPALIEVCDVMGINVPDSLREFAENKC